MLIKNFTTFKYNYEIQKGLTLIKYLILPIFLLVFTACSSKQEISNLEKIAQMQKMLEEKDSKIQELETQLENNSNPTNKLETQEKTKQVIVQEAKIVDGEKIPAIYKIVPAK